MPNMGVEVARKIYEILVRDAGAYPNDASDFIAAQTGPDSPTEWRFQGLLGYGGKFWVNQSADRPWFISCYKENRSQKAIAVIETVNEALAALHSDVIQGNFLAAEAVKVTPTHVRRIIEAANENVVGTTSLRAARRRPKVNEGW